MSTRALVGVAAAVAATACGGRTGLGTGAGAGQSDGGDGHPCQSEVIATDPQGATALSVDGDEVFWGTTDGLVERHGASGNAVLAAEAATIDALAVDATHVYYTTGGALRVVPRAGGVAADVATQLGRPLALALDVTTGSLYVLDYGAGIASGRVLRIDVAGTSGTVTELFTGLDVPSGLAVDEANVYFASHDALVSGQLVEGPLITIPKAGGLGAMLATGVHQSSSVALWGGDLYFIEQLDAKLTEHGGLRRVPKAGGDVSEIASTPNVLPLDVFVDASGAYVTTFSGQTNQNEGALWRFATDGSATSELAATPGVLYGFVRTSATAVYWTINWRGGHPPADGASVRKLCK